MIIKSTSIKGRGTNSIRRVVEYVFKEQKNAELIYTRYLPRNASIQTMVDELTENENLRVHARKDSVVIFHDFISFHESDSPKVQDEHLRRIAQMYADMRPNAINITVLHKEENRPTHLHIIASGVEYGTGKSTRIPRKEFKKHKILLEQYQEKVMRLEHRIHHDKGGIELRPKRSEQEMNRNGRFSDKQRLGVIVSELSKKARTLPQLQTMIEDAGIETYLRRGLFTGVRTSNGKRYRLRTLGIDSQKLERMIAQEKERLAQLRKQRNRTQDRNRKR